MRFNEFNAIEENISKAKSTNQIVKWLYNISSYIDGFSDDYILYRQFSTGDSGDQRPLMKINNGQHTSTDAKTGNNDSQAEVLNSLGITNPVFCRFVPPDSIEGKADPHTKLKHSGNNFIVVPPKNPRMFWSPVIYDLGEFYVNAINPTSGSSAGMSTDKIEDFIDSYQEGWPVKYPDSFTKNEIILDAKFYYLLNIESVLQIVNKELKLSIGAKEFDQDKYLSNFRTYGDISEFIKGDLTNIIKNAKTQVAQGVQQDKKSAKIQDRNKSFVKKEIDQLLSTNPNANDNDVKELLISLDIEDYITTALRYVTKKQAQAQTNSQRPAQSSEIE